MPILMPVRMTKLFHQNDKVFHQNDKVFHQNDKVFHQNDKVVHCHVMRGSPID